jgi:integrase
MTIARTSRKTKDPGLYRVDPSRIYPDGAWEVRYRDGNHRTRRKTFRTKQEAKDFRAKTRTDIGSGTWIDPALATTPFRTVAENWYSSPENEHWKPKTRQGYRHTLNRYLLPAFGDRAIGRIQVADLRDFLNGLPEHLSSNSRRAIYRSLSPIFKQALVDGMVTANPVPLVKTPKAVRPEMRTLSRDQVAALAGEIAPQHQTMIWFMAATGVRAGEVAALQVKNLDPLRRKVRIERSLADVNVEFSGTGSRTVFGTPKSGKPREFTVSPFLMDMLTEQIAGKSPEDLVFTGSQGGPIRWGNFRGRHFRPAITRLTTETPNEPARWPKELSSLRIHDLRHTCASLLIDAGVHAKAISDQLGHSSINVTMDIYGHMLNPDTVANAMESTFTASREAPTDSTVVSIR